MSGWADSDRRDRLPSNWPQLVAKVKKRDGGQCRWVLPSKKRCPRAGTEVDHIRNNDDDSMGNLRLLCHDHHAQATARQARFAKAKRKASRYRPPEDHPGRLR